MKIERIKLFFRYNAVALFSTALDFCTTVVLTESFDLNFAYSTAIGAIAGTISAFTLGRSWAFKSKSLKKRIQGLRFLGVSIGSLVLNTTGSVFLAQELEIMHYAQAKTIVALLVSLLYNYPLQKKYVFRN